jgi:hypothetical protein
MLVTPPHCPLVTFYIVEWCISVWVIVCLNIFLFIIFRVFSYGADNNSSCLVTLYDCRSSVLCPNKWVQLVVQPPHSMQESNLTLRFIRFLAVCQTLESEVFILAFLKSTFGPHESHVICHNIFLSWPHLVRFSEIILAVKCPYFIVYATMAAVKYQLLTLFHYFRTK